MFLLSIWNASPWNAPKVPCVQDEKGRFRHSNDALPSSVGPPRVHLLHSLYRYCAANRSKEFFHSKPVFVTRLTGPTFFSRLWAFMSRGSSSVQVAQVLPTTAAASDHHHLKFSRKISEE